MPRHKDLHLLVEQIPRVVVKKVFILWQAILDVEARSEVAFCFIKLVKNTQGYKT